MRGCHEAKNRLFHYKMMLKKHTRIPTTRVEGVKYLVAELS
jgi:hypothetical protein